MFKGENCIYLNDEAMQEIVQEYINKRISSANSEVKVLSVEVDDDSLMFAVSIMPLLKVVK